MTTKRTHTATSAPSGDGGVMIRVPLAKSATADAVRKKLHKGGLAGGSADRMSLSTKAQPKPYTRIKRSPLYAS